MADDVRALLDHLKIERADIMGYSMGARITAFLAVKHPERVRSAILGGLGVRLVEGVGLPESIAEALGGKFRSTMFTIRLAVCFVNLPNRPGQTFRRSPPASVDRGKL